MIHFQQPCVGSLAHFGGKIVSRQDSGSVAGSESLVVPTDCEQWTRCSYDRIHPWKMTTHWHWKTDRHRTQLSFSASVPVPVTAVRIFAYTEVSLSCPKIRQIFCMSFFYKIEKISDHDHTDYAIYFIASKKGSNKFKSHQIKLRY